MATCLSLRDVSFGYPGSRKNVLDHVSLKLSLGEKVAVVGENGAGKSILIKILMGFLRPDEGDVLLGDVDIRKYNKEHYYRLFSAVFQNSSVLAGSIMCNVSQSYDGSDVEKVKACMEKAGLAENFRSR